MKSNSGLLILRQNLISWYKKYEYVINPVLKFLVFFLVLYMLKQGTRYDGAAGNILILMGLSVIGAFAPAEGIIVGMILITTLYVAAMNLIVGGISFIFLSMIYILYGRLFPRESLFIIVTVAAFNLKIELAVPFIAALLGNYAAVIAIIIGTVIWYTMPVLIQAVPSMPLDKSQLLETVNSLLGIDYKALLFNKQMLVMCIIAFVVFTCIYIIKNSGVDYGAYMGIVTGATMNILGFVMAKVFFYDLRIDLLIVIIQIVIFAVIAAVIQFFAVVLDYQRAEIVNFEDDDNYYHVKIIPKIQMAAKKKTIKHVYTEKKKSTSYTRNSGLFDDTLHTPDYGEIVESRTFSRSKTSSGHGTKSKENKQENDKAKDKVNRLIMEDDDFKF